MGTKTRKYILRNSILTLLEHSQVHTLGEISKLLTSERFRRYILAELENKKLKNFWNYEFPQYFIKGWSAESIAAILNKIGVLNVNPIPNGIINHSRNQINFRKIINEKKALMANLSKGRIGEDVSMLLGSLILSSFHSASLTRQDIPEEKRNFSSYSWTSFKENMNCA